MLANQVLLVSPIGFSSNPETAASNAFQNADQKGDVASAALMEHESLVAALEGHGVNVTLLAPHRDDIPDAVFPNNWFSTDLNGTLILYPMEAVSRRREIRPDFAAELVRSGFSINDTVDMSEAAESGGWLEGTGSLVLDHVNRIAYAAESTRTNPGLVREWCSRFGFSPCIFIAVDPDGKPIYHTNVMMGLGEKAAIVCAEIIPDREQRNRILAQLGKHGRLVIEISWEQLCCFAGNVLFLAGKESEIMMISRRGWNSLDGSQQATISRIVEPVPVAVDTLESMGGGSVRCMIAEIFLPLSTG